MPATSPFLAWERLRLVYNGILAVAVSPLAFPVAGELEFWVFVALAIVAANVCFCAGPVAENYLALFGFGRRLSRWLIFVPGTIFACLLAGVAMISFVMNQAEF